MSKKAQSVSDPLSHNPTVYYHQARNFSRHQVTHIRPLSYSVFILQDHANSLLYLSLALDANTSEENTETDAAGIGSLIMATQALR